MLIDEKQMFGKIPTQSQFAKMLAVHVPLALAQSVHVPFVTPEIVNVKLAGAEGHPVHQLKPELLLDDPEDRLLESEDEPLLIELPELD